MLTDTNIEKIHLRYLKHALGVHKRTCNTGIYGETGRYPLSINVLLNIIKYWIRLTEIPQDTRHTAQ